jgi:hypothetical protein
LRPKILACLVLFSIAMEAVNLGAHQIVGHFGIIGGLLTIAAMYGAARWYDHRERRRSAVIEP